MYPYKKYKVCGILSTMMHAPVQQFKTVKKQTKQHISTTSQLDAGKSRKSVQFFVFYFSMAMLLLKKF